MTDKNLKVGQTVFVKGLDMRCNRCIVVAKIHKVLSESEIEEYGWNYDCVTISDGVKVLSNSAEHFSSREEAKNWLKQSPVY